MTGSKLRTLAGAALLMVLLPPAVQNVYAQVPVTTQDLEQFEWRHIGPWTFSGRVSEVAVPPGQNKVYYALAASGGVWKTEDHGTSFRPIFENYGNQSTGFLGIAPSNPDILYLGTGEAIHSRAAAHGNGVWKSTDAGETWTHVGLEKSYYINKVLVHPTNPDIVYVAAEGQLYDNEMDSQRGLYKTTDGGKTWTNVFPVKDRGPGDFVMDTRNPDVIIAAAYKTFRRAWTFIDRQEGNWLYKTTDGGKTWKRLENGLPMNKKMGRPGLGMSPSNPNIVYARLDELVSLGFSRTPAGALYRRNALREGYTMSDFGKFRPNRQIARLVTHDVVKASDEADLVNQLNQIVNDDGFAGRAVRDLGELNTAARSAFPDDQALMGSIEGIEEMMAWNPSDDQGKRAKSAAINRHILSVIYAPALEPESPTTRDGRVYRSDDQGETWKAMTEYAVPEGGGGGFGGGGGGFGGQGGQQGSQPVNDTEAGYYGKLVVDPKDPDMVYLPNTRPKISRDGGKTFENLPWQGNQGSHVDTRGIWVDPLDSDHILNCNDGGLTETWDGGQHWSQKDMIPAQQFYDVSVDNEMPYNVMGGTQDNGCWIGPSMTRNGKGVFPSDWRYLPTGDGFYAVRDWWNPEWIYFESQFGSSTRMNLDTGESISLSRGTNRAAQEQGLDTQRFQWDSPIVLSPHNPGIVFIASQYVWRSPAHGDADSWQRISPDLTRSDPERIALSHETNMQYPTVYTFAESPVTPGVYWAGTDDGNLQVSIDGGQNWTNITYQFYNEDGSPKRGTSGDRIPFDRWVVQVQPSAFDVNTCYVTWSGYRTHGEDTTYIFSTNDMGKTWKDLSGGMQAPARDVVEDPDNADVLYMATDYGLYATFDRGSNWVRMSESAPDVSIYDLDIQKRDRDLAIGTFGRGIYLMDIGPLAQFRTPAFTGDAHLFDPERVVQWQMYMQAGQDYGEFAVTPNPRPSAALYYWLKSASDEVSIVIKNAEGREIANVDGEKAAGLHRLDWNMQETPQGGQGGRGGPGGGGGFRGRGRPVGPGTYTVVLMVGGAEASTATLQIVPDPMFK